MEEFQARYLILCNLIRGGGGSPNTLYKSTGLLDLIDEINYNFGRHPDAPAILERIPTRGEEAVSQLLKVYDDTGWNFLQNGRSYTRSGPDRYASATRPFDINTDFIGFLVAHTPLNPYGVLMHSMIPRVKIDGRMNPLSKTGPGASFTGRREFSSFLDYNKGQRPFLAEFFDANIDRTINLRFPFKTGLKSLVRANFMGPITEAITTGAPSGITGTVVGITNWMDHNRKDRIEKYKTLSDEVVLSMDERDRRMYTPEGVDNLYQYYRTNPMYEGATLDDLDRAVDYNLRTTYDKYQNKKETGN